MLVRAVASWQRDRWIRVTAIAAIAGIAIAAARPQLLAAQETAGTMPKTHTVKRGDTLWDIAKLYLGDAFLWPEIYRQNTDLIEDPHWIYPGESLKLPAPTAKVVAVTPPAATPRAAMPTVVPVAPAPADTTPAPLLEPARSSVRIGEYSAAPWVDARRGPSGSGYIIQAADIPGIAVVDQSSLHVYDRVMIAPPTGASAEGRQVYLTYRLGPFIEDLGQIIIPTGLIEVPRPAQPGEAAVGRVVKMFGPMIQGQRLIPYDTSAAVAIGRPSPVTNGSAGKVRWILSEPVIASLQDYLVLDISKRDGVNVGDQIELYQPRQRPTDGRALALPEVPIGRAQVLRVTPFGATAIVTTQDQPRIEEGTAARVAAKMP
jgi:hypothetical protein